MGGEVGLINAPVSAARLSRYQFDMTERIPEKVGDNRKTGLIAGLVVVIVAALVIVRYYARRPSAGPNSTLPGNFARPAKPPGVNGPG